jgi:hypothetical protein
MCIVVYYMWSPVVVLHWPGAGATIPAKQNSTWPSETLDYVLEENIPEIFIPVGILSVIE